MYLETHKEIEGKMQKTINVIKDELNSIRAGRANPAMLDKISLDYYGSITPLKQIATVTAPEPRMIIIQPYDKSAMQSIEKAIMTSDLGLNPSNDGKVIRLNIPQLTEERRRDLLKIVKRTAEDGKVAIRNERREANEAFKKQQKDGELTEDDLKKAQEEVQKITDNYIKKIDELVAKKEVEILEV
ncbi:ribosome recycling factor [Alkaliphilus peptidifermentans]|uniref:Ribosome-recycling factor n=1 Tax=Alkaliphilus peptidifermentans DSM 18978 TaxID=1120976 RepID=A0A1G5DEV4_9FIRM|nr:ribosome recycling factor [Alkaliphilus peptidifermentans]SCY12968.1 ribosome recycling factor [Alkaliphilus peptidifermentans DSM 18978]